jgi:hypothetical protein
MYLISNIPTIDLDSPSAQLLMHGISISYSLTDISKELTTFNTRLALLQQPRWLIPDAKREGRLAFMIIITATGLKAQEFVQQLHLSCFTSTLRLER